MTSAALVCDAARRCGHCAEWLPPAAFDRIWSDRPWPLQSFCRACSARRRTEWNRKHLDRHRVYVRAWRKQRRYETELRAA
jgi:hypothetical protein